ncbi:antiviral reverse transcriptase Drt3a [Arsukibacterium indicum]|uniref:RNA-directed DNA polymerase n=1 Tax=Arsukibacterium indicum TaxID=2848612 RepID=A0ABS6MJZ8_9GAMM|nr:antiviral reverse transcriptase Drt3a [Arsukibacterium indicum]MBV2129140.1 RNA-directed DNA polymerase [Arsukibacterium indicum]
MLNQSLSQKNLEQLQWRTSYKFNNGIVEKIFFEDTFKEIQRKLSNIEYEFDDFKIKKIKKSTTTSGNNIAYDSGTAADELIIRKVNDNIKRLFRIKTADRNSIVKQVISLLHDSQPIFITRLDIKSFYDSIDANSLIEEITRDNLLSYESRMILLSFREKLSVQRINGLPRGLCLSATLSELRLRKFDQKIREIREVYYYARFVDDIIIFSISPATEIIKLAERILKEAAPELQLNTGQKLSLISPEKNKRDYSTLDYLGYRINFESRPSKKNKRKVVVKISPKKISKIKNRIQRSITAFSSNKNVQLLKARIKFLTGNQYVIGDAQRTKLKSGIYYNYQLINDKSQLSELDQHFNSLFTSHHPPIKSAISELERMGLLSMIKRYSFRFGFECKVMNSFDKRTRTKIKGCW